MALWIQYRACNSELSLVHLQSWDPGTFKERQYLPNVMISLTYKEERHGGPSVSSLWAGSLPDEEYILEYLIYYLII